MLANLSAFPAVIAMFLLGKLFIDTFNNIPEDKWIELFVPPLLGNPAQNASDMIGSLVAIGILLSTPGVVKMTKEAFKAGGISYGPIGQSLGAGQAFVGGVGGAIWSRMYWRDREGVPHGVAADIGRGAGRRLGGTRPVSAVRNRVSNLPGIRTIAGLRRAGRGDAPPRTGNTAGAPTPEDAARAAARNVTPGDEDNTGTGA